jgi:hypothetical protein
MGTEAAAARSATPASRVRPQRQLRSSALYIDANDLLYGADSESRGRQDEHRSEYLRTVRKYERAR